MSAMNVHGVGHVPRGASDLLPIPLCASANGITQMAGSRSRKNALRRRCALMEGLFCFFILFDPPGIMFGVESALLLKNAEECQEIFVKVLLSAAGAVAIHVFTSAHFFPSTNAAASRSSAA